MNNNENIFRLIEAVETSGADIAPTYAEYIQLAFAIATDLGEAGREAFHRLCRLSAKYDRAHADTVYTGALKNGRGDVHLGTAFHLAEQAGVKIGYDSGRRTEADMRGTLNIGKEGTQGTRDTPSFFLTHTCVREGTDAEDCSETELADSSAVEEETVEGSEPQQPLPCFPQSAWPEFIMRAISYGDSKAQRDALLLGVLTVCGAGMGRYVRCLYGGKMQSPCLQTFVVAPPASGKGVLSLVRLLAEPIHDDIRQRVETKMAEYRKQKAAYDSMGRDKANAETPKMPLNKMFIISGNNTGTGILQNIMDSDGMGIICETEADTITTAIGSDYGHWSDTLRKAFDHDRLAYNRRTDQEYREVKKSYLSVLLSGTPAQVRPLIPSAENGLFSRQLFYYMPGIHKWKNQFIAADTDLEAVFTNMGKEWKQMVDMLKMNGIYTLRLTDSQKEEFNTLFARLFYRSGLANGSEMSSSVARLAINTCRIMSVVAMLRAMERWDVESGRIAEGGEPLMRPADDTPPDNVKDGIVSHWSIIISEDDFRAVLGIVEPLYRHSTHILSFLPATEVVRRSNADRDALMGMMADEFTRKQFKAAADGMGIKTNTAYTWLKRMVRRGAIECVDGKGSYRKKADGE